MANSTPIPMFIPIISNTALHGGAFCIYCISRLSINEMATIVQCIGVTNELYHTYYRKCMQKCSVPKKARSGEKQAWEINPTGFAYLSCNCHFGVFTANKSMRLCAKGNATWYIDVWRHEWNEIK